jgi:hypothetical protein
MPLEALRCDGNRVADLGPVADAPLRRLDASQNLLEALPSLATRKLEWCDLSLNRLPALDALAGQRRLRQVIADYNLVEDLSPLATLPRLKSLDLRHNRLATLDRLRGTGVTTLAVTHNDIADLSPLAGLSLDILRCADNRIEDLSPLAGLPLSVVTSGGNLLTSLDPFVDDPPPWFLFDCDSLPDAELERAAAKWREHEASAHLARDAMILLALRRGDDAAIKAQARELDGHRYLQIPRLVTWEEARRLCEDLGGHLATCTTTAQNGLLVELGRPEPPWIGLVGTPGGGRKWITGEPMGYRKESKFGLGLELRTGYLMTGLGYLNLSPDPKEKRSFICEWDG